MAIESAVNFRDSPATTATFHFSENAVQLGSDFSSGFSDFRHDCHATLISVSLLDLYRYYDYYSHCFFCVLFCIVWGLGLGAWSLGTGVWERGLGAGTGWQKSDPFWRPARVNCEQGEPVDPRKSWEKWTGQDGPALWRWFRFHFAFGQVVALLFSHLRFGTGFNFIKWKTWTFLIV